MDFVINIYPKKLISLKCILYQAYTHIETYEVIYCFGARFLFIHLPFNRACICCLYYVPACTHGTFGTGLMAVPMNA